MSIKEVPQHHVIFLVPSVTYVIGSSDHWVPCSMDSDRLHPHVPHGLSHALSHALTTMWCFLVFPTSCEFPLRISAHCTVATSLLGLRHDSVRL